MPTDFSYELGDFTFGRGTEFKIARVDFGSADITEGSIPNPRADGVRFGRDYKGGRTITFEGNIFGVPADTSVGRPEGAYHSLERIETAWEDPSLRLNPGEVKRLSMHRAGRSRCVFGRPGRFASTSGAGMRGWLPITFDFKTSDHLYYSDGEFVENVPFIPTGIGGLEGELIGPIVASGATEGSGSLNVGGTQPTWLTYKINGPISGPMIEVTDEWRAQLAIDLLYDQYVIVDPRPWARTVRRNDGANLSGAFTAQSVRISQMKLQPGRVNQVLLRGYDPTGTSSVDVYWRDAYSSY